jgi:hypothetical protein
MRGLRTVLWRADFAGNFLTKNAIDNTITAVDADVNATINHIDSSIKSIIADAAQTANALAGNVTEDILKIVSAGSDAVQKAEQTFFTDASQLLKEINAIVQKGQCMEAAGAKQIQDQIYKVLEGLNPMYRFSSCWRSLGYGVTTSLESLTDIQLYDYQKQCTLLNKITPNTPIGGANGILEIYAQGQLYAAEYNCIGETAGAPAFQDLMTKEWVWWGVQYNSWKNMQTNKLEAAVAPLTDDPSCGTPVECYAKAIKALNDATAKIAPLQAAVQQNAASISSNTAAITKNDPTKMTMAWCDCYNELHWQVIETCPDSSAAKCGKQGCSKQGYFSTNFWTFDGSDNEP